MNALQAIKIHVIVRPKSVSITLAHINASANLAINRKIWIVWVSYKILSAVTFMT